jgi:hypothetical protein
VVMDIGDATDVPLGDVNSLLMGVGVGLVAAKPIVGRLALVSVRLLGCDWVLSTHQCVFCHHAPCDTEHTGQRWQ